MREIIIAADHNGFAMKNALRVWLEKEGYTVTDLGPDTLDPQDDYPDFALRAAEEVAAAADRRGILICGSGVGMAAAASKVGGVMAALIHDPAIARAAQRDDRINMLALGASYIDLADAKEVISAWLTTPFSGAARHRRRIRKIAAYEQAHTCTCDMCSVLSSQADRIEIVPAILRSTLDEIRADWQAIVQEAEHVQIDVTDGVFAGTGTFRDLVRLRELAHPQKMELHLMVQDPATYKNTILKLAPARCVFHVEAFKDAGAVQDLYDELRRVPGIALGLAVNPATALTALDPVIDAIDFVLFMGYEPGIANQPINPAVFDRVKSFCEQHGHVPVAVDGHVTLETAPHYVQAGARILCANTSIFGQGNPQSNLQKLREVAHDALGKS